MKHIINFSGGKDSTALLFMMIEKSMRVDEVIYCNTGRVIQNKALRPRRALSKKRRAEQVTKEDYKTIISHN